MAWCGVRRRNENRNIPIPKYLHMSAVTEYNKIINARENQRYGFKHLFHITYLPSEYSQPLEGNLQRS